MHLHDSGALPDTAEFYATTATILAAALLGSLLEMRTLRDRFARTPLQRVVLTLWAVILVLGAITLATIPGALVSGDIDGWATPRRLMDVTMAVVAVVLAAPFGVLVMDIWRNEDPPEAPRVAPLVEPPTVQPATSRPWWPIGLVVLALLAWLRRKAVQRGHREV
jgi:MYXO-CTERM domain-containing protein